jgi:hypothetical protein
MNRKKGAAVDTCTGFPFVEEESSTSEPSGQLYSGGREFWFTSVSQSCFYYGAVDSFPYGHETVICSYGCVQTVVISSVTPACLRALYCTGFSVVTVW